MGRASRCYKRLSNRSRKPGSCLTICSVTAAGGGLRVSCCGQSSRMILLPILEGFEIVSRSLGCQRSCKDRRVAGAVAVEVFDASPSSFAILGEIDLDLVGVEGLNSSDARPLCRTKGGRRLPRSFVVSWPLLPRGEPRPSKTSAGPAAPLCVWAASAWAVYPAGKLTEKASAVVPTGTAGPLAPSDCFSHRAGHL
jgi:hypothetical protein